MLVDLELAVSATSTNFIPDGVHPSDTGTQLIADAFAATLLTMMPAAE